MDYLGYGYAVVVILGGVMGYAKAGSVMSLLAGLSFGSLAALGAKQLSDDPSRYHTLLVVSCTLGTLMGYRFMNSQKFMPAGLMATLSVATALRLIIFKAVLKN